MSRLKINPQTLDLGKIMVSILLFWFGQSIALGQSAGYGTTDVVESIRKTICLNGFWNTACSSNGPDILQCAKEYSGEQAQRICQYQLGFARRQLEIIIEINRRQAALETEKERIRKNEEAALELKIKIANAKVREENARGCINSEYPGIHDILKNIRDISKMKYGRDLSESIDAMGFDMQYKPYVWIQGIKSIPEGWRPVLSTSAQEIIFQTSCDSVVKYYGYIVSLDGKKIDGFLAYRNLNDWWVEINELEWLGPRITVEVKRLKSIVKAEEDRKNLEKIEKEANTMAAEARDKSIADTRLKFFLWSVIVAMAVVSFAGFKKWQKSKTSLKPQYVEFNKIDYRHSYESLTDLEKINPQINENFLYNYKPATTHQIDMQNIFRGKNPFVKHNVRFEHMDRFIKACNQYQEKNGDFPDQTVQHEILLKIASGHYF